VIPVNGIDGAKAGNDDLSAAAETGNRVRRSLVSGITNMDGIRLSDSRAAVLVQDTVSGGRYQIRADSSAITADTLAAGQPGSPVTKDPNAVQGRTGRSLPAPYTLRTGGTDIKLIPRPGLHSDADLIIFFPRESVVDMGDLLLSESMPAANDIPGYLAFLMKEGYTAHDFEDFLEVHPSTDGVYGLLRYASEVLKKREKGD
jgi:hypothetical protein